MLKFFTPSTSKALKGFHKALDQLARVAAMEAGNAEKHARRVEAEAAKRDAAHDRAAEAHRIHEKLSELVA